MSLWQFNAVVAGYLDAHVPEKPGMSQAEADDVWQWLQTKPDRVVQ